jgi:hypothetical protein
MTVYLDPQMLQAVSAVVQAISSVVIAILTAVLILVTVSYTKAANRSPKVMEQDLALRSRPIVEGVVGFYSKDADADRAFLGDVLGFKSVDAGHGWLIFTLPPAEAAIHPSEGNETHELFFLCDDLKAEIASLAKKEVVCSAIEEARWGSITKMRLPGGGQIGLYQPKHPTALALK